MTIGNSKPAWLKVCQNEVNTAHEKWRSKPGLAITILQTHYAVINGPNIYTCSMLLFGSNPPPPPPPPKKKRKEKKNTEMIKDDYFNKDIDAF